MHVAQPRIRRMSFSISESLTRSIKAVSVSQRINQTMKLKLVTVVLASAVAVSSASASERVYRHSHHRNTYNSMNLMHAPADAPSYGSSNGAHPYGFYGPSSEYPGGASLSGTGPSQFGGGAVDGAGGGGGGP